MPSCPCPWGAIALGWPCVLRRLAASRWYLDRWSDFGVAPCRLCRFCDAVASSRPLERQCSDPLFRSWLLHFEASPSRTGVAFPLTTYDQEVYNLSLPHGSQRYDQAARRALKPQSSRTSGHRRERIDRHVDASSKASVRSFGRGSFGAGSAHNTIGRDVAVGRSAGVLSLPSSTSTQARWTRLVTRSGPRFAVRDQPPRRGEPLWLLRPLTTHPEHPCSTHHRKEPPTYGSHPRSGLQQKAGAAQL